MALSDLVIGEVTIACDLPRCESASERERFRRLVALEPGKRYRPEDGQRAVWFLEQTELFVPGSIGLSTQPGGAGTVDIVLSAEGRTYIRDVDIDVGLSLEEEVEQRLFMRSGRAYDPTEVQRQVESIRSIFERDGYYGTQVQIIAEEVEPYLVDIDVLVDKGERLDVRNLYVRGHEAFEYEEIREIIIGELGFFRTYTREGFDDGIGELLDRYREADYLRARVVSHEAIPDFRAGVVDLYVDIYEGPQWSFEFTGNRVFSDDDLMEVLPFFEIGYIDEAEIEASAADVEALYRTAGYYFVNVRARQERTGEGRFLVTYVIFEGELAEIRSIDFDGNQSAPDEDLLALMSTNVYSALDSGGFLQPEQLEADIRTIEAYLHELGHLSAHVPRWTVVSDAETRSLYVTIFVVEGARTRVSDVRFRGNGIFTSRQLSRRLRLANPRITDSGDSEAVFGPAGLASDIATVQNRYLERGFRLNKLDTVCQVRGDDPAVADVSAEEDASAESWIRCEAPRFPAACIGYSEDRCSQRRRGGLLVQECGRIDDAQGCELSGGIQSDEVVIEYRLAEGQLVTLGEVFVIGAYDTDEDIIRNEIRLSRGDPFNPTLLYESQASLRSLGLFNSVRVRTIGVGGEGESSRVLGGDRTPYTANRAAVVVHVEEAPSQFIELRLGLSSENRVDDAFRVVAETQLGFIDRNFLGRALLVQLLGFFKADVVGAARVTDGEFVGGVAGILTDPRFDWFNAADDPWELRTLLGYRYDLLSATLHEILIEGEAQVRQEFDAIEGLFFSLALNVTRAVTKQPDEAEFEDPDLILRLEPALTLERRNSPLNPTRGYRAELVIELADRFFGRGVDTAEFTKIRLAGSYLIPFGRSFVLGLSLRFGFALGGVFSGFVRPDSPEDGMILPDSERFRLGGVSGVRGFADNALGPTGANGQPIFGDVVLNGTAELRFPLVPSIDLYGAWFVDGGQLATGFADLTTEDFRFSTGLGIRLLAFGLVPVVLDYGLALDRRLGERIGQLQFNVGYTF